MQQSATLPKILIAPNSVNHLETHTVVNGAIGLNHIIV